MQWFHFFHDAVVLLGSPPPPHVEYLSMGLRSQKNASQFYDPPFDSKKLFLDFFLNKLISKKKQKNKKKSSWPKQTPPQRCVLMPALLQRY